MATLQQCNEKVKESTAHAIYIAVCFMYLNHKPTNSSGRRTAVILIASEITK